MDKTFEENWKVGSLIGELQITCVLLGNGNISLEDALWQLGRIQNRYSKTPKADQEGELKNDE